MLKRVWWLLCCVGVVLVGCEETERAPARRAHEVTRADGLSERISRETFEGDAALAPTRTEQGLVIASDSGTLRGLALRFDALRGDPGLQSRVSSEGGWTEWRDVEVTWSEAGLFNARVDLDGASGRVALRQTASTAALTFLYVELHEASLPQTIARPAADLRTATQALAPTDIVNGRSTWGARTPSCQGDSHQPRAITIHHTATPNNDSATPAARLRQIQSFHLDTRGWCDIGYHFLISQDGEVWQGRETELRQGAHVGGHNDGNIGVGFLGNFDEVEVPQAMLDGGVEVVAWLAQTYDISLDRQTVIGHREWSSASTVCPGKNLLPQIDGLISAARSGNSGASSTPQGEDTWTGGADATPSPSPSPLPLPSCQLVDARRSGQGLPWWSALIVVSWLGLGFARRRG